MRLLYVGNFLSWHLLPNSEGYSYSVNILIGAYWTRVSYQRILRIQHCPSVHPSALTSIRPFSQNWLITFFCFFSLSWESTNTIKWRSSFFEKNYCFAKNVENRLFLGSKSTLLNSSLNLFIWFFGNRTWDRH